MKLVRLKVENFGTLRYVRLDFGPGLNVLYGPNDLGKSTLGAALRTVLLVPSTSTVAKRWIEWQGDQTPQVELVFQTDERRYWRVKKSFGTGTRGTALLESSRDGNNFSTEARGRQVDGELRNILRWGIPSPGGRSAPRGEPETFLTAALLARQEEVAGVFERGLAEDLDESGRDQLTEALQTLGQDPLFKKALEISETKVNEVFTPRGGKKKGRLSPLVIAAEKINQAEREAAELHVQDEQTQALQERLENLHARQLEQHTTVEEARSRLSGAERMARRGEAQSQLSAIEAKLAAIAELEAQEKDLERTLGTRKERLDEVTTVLEVARQEQDDAAEAVRRAKDADADARRQVEQQKLEKRQLEIRADRDEAGRRMERARGAVALVADVESSEKELASGRQRLETLDAEEREARSEVERWQLLERFLRYQEAEGARQSLAEKAQRAATWRDEAQAKSDEATAIRASEGVERWPSVDEMSELRGLREDYRVAKARLEVGFSVALKPKGRVGVRFSRDGEDLQEETLSLPVTLEAERLLRLDVEDLMEIRLRGGSQELREEVETLGDRFDAKAGPWLKRTDTATIEELDAASRNAGGKVRRASELEQEASSLLAQAAALDDDDGRLTDLERRAEELRGALAGEDLEDLAAAARECNVTSVGELERGRALPRRRFEEVTETLQELRVDLAGRETRLETLRTELEATRGVLDGPPEEVLTGAEATFAKLDAEAAVVAEKLGAVQVETTSSSSVVEERLERAQEAVATAAATKAEAATQRDAVQQSLARLRGELEVRREQAAGLDREAAARELAVLEDAMGHRREEASELDVEAARQKLSEEETILVELEAEVREEEGALKQVGGDVVRERLERANEALEEQQKRETELELDYAAWKLLGETLREAENDQASHLGQALVNPVSERFRKLTRGRYAELQLGPSLETQGIRAAGGIYGVETLSVGTRHQLSTLFRLAVAEQLESTVVLDDQLVQSDIQTMAYFRDLLKEKAGSIQIVVLTCRPEEYLEPADMPGRGNGAERDSDDGRVRAIDLEQLVRSGRRG
jgi:chromosome segregation ATPase